MFLLIKLGGKILVYLRDGNRQRSLAFCYAPRQFAYSVPDSHIILLKGICGPAPCRLISHASISQSNLRVLVARLQIVEAYCPKATPVFSWSICNCSTLFIPGWCFHPVENFQVVDSLQGRDGYLINGVQLTKVCAPRKLGVKPYGC